MEDNVLRFLGAALIAAASISAAPALAQDSYPNKPIKIVLPVPPGSALDIATRAIGEQLSVRWGQQVLIEARPGAGGLIAGQAVASAPPGLRGPLQSGDLKLIGQMAPQREPEYPSVPTVSETNPGISAIGFMTLAAPAGIPESIQRRLADGLRQALDSPAVKKSYADLGVPIRNYTPEQTKAFVENEQKIWWPLVREFTPPEARN